MISALWALVVAIAVLWPARLAGPLDGMPLDTPLEAVVIGLVLVWLVVAYPRVLSQRPTRVLVIGLLLWKAATGATLVQDGWCLKFTSPVPLFVGEVTVPHAWDVRADWRSPVPECSAIMVRDYPELERFPAWFYNLPPASLKHAVGPGDRPPGATSRLDLTGVIHASEPGTLKLLAGDDVTASGTIDGTEVTRAELASGVAIRAGLHRVAVRADLRNSHWSLTPLWNDANLWAATTATVAPPSVLDLWIRPWGRFVPAALIAGLLLSAARSMVLAARSPLLLGYAGAAVTIVAAISLGGLESVLRWVPLLLAGVIALTVPRQLNNRLGWALVVGLPFLAIFAGAAVRQAGLFTWYSSGDDWWMFQRFAYRIFMQGYWLEGGEATFWFQPLYRWIAGSLHMIFGDSSVGELLWDAGAALTGAAFAFQVAKTAAGFRWGVAAACVTLAMFTVGPAWYLFGRGLSELSSAGFLYAAAMFAMRGRGGYWPAIAMAGLLASLAFLTRMNNLPMALAVAVFAWPMRMPVASAWAPRTLWLSASPRVVAGVLLSLAVALHLFTLRTWFYTGVYSMLHGTSTSVNTMWKDGESLWQSLASSVLMVLTMSDPARFDLRAVPMLAGFAAALLGLARVRPFSQLPLPLVAWCVAGISSALVVRGGAYPGRFSVHMIPVTVALFACAVALVCRRRRLATPEVEVSR